MIEISPFFRHERLRNLSIKVQTFFYWKIANSFNLKDFAIFESKNDLFFEFERYGNLSWGKNDEFFLWKIAYCFCERLPDLLFSIQLIPSIILKKNGLNIWKTIWRTSWSETEQSVARKLSYIFTWMTGLCIPGNSISSFKTKLISFFVSREYYFHTGTIENELFALCYSKGNIRTSVRHPFWQTGASVLTNWLYNLIYNFSFGI